MGKHILCYRIFLQPIIASIERDFPGVKAGDYHDPETVLPEIPEIFPLAGSSPPLC